MSDAQSKRYAEIRKQSAELLPEHLRYGAKVSKEQLSREEAEKWKALRKQFSTLEAELRDLRKLNPMLPENAVKQYGPA